MDSSNNNQEVLAQLKKNEAYLESIATTQQELLAVNKQRLNTERYKLIMSVVKMGLIIVITWISFVAAKSMLTGLTQNMGGLLTSGNKASSATPEILKQLQGSNEIIDLLKNF